MSLIILNLVVLERLMAVLLRIEAHRAVYPHHSLAVVLKQQLVEVDVLLNETEVLLAQFQAGQENHGVGSGDHSSMIIF